MWKSNTHKKILSTFIRECWYYYPTDYAPRTYTWDCTNRSLVHYLTISSNLVEANHRLGALRDGVM